MEWNGWNTCEAATEGAREKESAGLLVSLVILQNGNITRKNLVRNTISQVDPIPIWGLKEDLSSFKLLWDRPEQKPERKIQKER